MENKKLIKFVNALVKGYLDEKYGDLGVVCEISLDTYILSCGILDHIDYSDFSTLSEVVNNWLEDLKDVYDKEVFLQVKAYKLDEPVRIYEQPGWYGPIVTKGTTFINFDSYYSCDDLKKLIFIPSLKKSKNVV